MVEGGPPAQTAHPVSLRGSGAARASGRWFHLPRPRPIPVAAGGSEGCAALMWRCRARGRPPRSRTVPVGSARRGDSRPARGAETRVPTPGVLGVGGARGRERAGPTRSHPEPGRDPAQRRRVLWGRPHGRRGRRGHPPPSVRRGPDGASARGPRRRALRATRSEPAPAAGWSSGSSLGS